MEAIDIILIILCIVTTIGFGTIFVIVVRRILEKEKPVTEDKSKQPPASKPLPQV